MQPPLAQHGLELLRMAGEGEGECMLGLNQMDFSDSKLRLDGKITHSQYAKMSWEL